MGLAQFKTLLLFNPLVTVGARSSTPTPSGSRPVSYSDNNNSNSSSLALSIATMRPGQMDMAINSKKVMSV